MKVFQSGMSVFTLLGKVLLGFGIVLSVAVLVTSMGTLPTEAQPKTPAPTTKPTTTKAAAAAGPNFQGADGSCKLQTQIKMADILAPGKFFPVIPAACSTTADGQAVPLSLAVLPDIAIRFFGALVSFVFYLFSFIAVFSGVQWIYGGIDEKQALQAKRNFSDSFFGLILTLSAYLIINTLVITVLKVEFEYTSMNDFFTF